MRVMVDTNILVSAAINPTSITALSLTLILQEHTLIICTHVLDELQSVFARKFPHKALQLDVFLSSLSYELCYTPKVTPNIPDMRDEDDRPILQAALDVGADAILTGDNDFHALEIDRPMIISPSELLKRFSISD